MEALIGLLFGVIMAALTMFVIEPKVSKVSWVNDTSAMTVVATVIMNVGLGILLFSFVFTDINEKRAGSIVISSTFVSAMAGLLKSYFRGPKISRENYD